MAAQLDPAAPLVHTNLAMALLSVKRYAEAEAAARRAPAADSAFPSVQYAFQLVAAARRQLPPNDAHRNYQLDSAFP